MDRNWKRSLYAFFLCLGVFFFFSPRFSALHIQYFSPFLVLLYYEKPKIICLWCAFLCGLCMDMASVASPFGTFALLYTLVSTFLYERKPLFFEDHITTIPLLTALFCALVTLSYAFVLRIIGLGFPFTLPWIGNNLFLLPLLEGVYAFLLLLPLRSMRRNVPRRDPFILRKRSWQR